MAVDEGDVTLATTVPDVKAPGEVPPTFERTGDGVSARFEVGVEIGRGGMGRVLAATDVSLERSVAIKQLHSQDAGDLIRFEREVRITAQLEHPSIVPIHEAGTDEQGRPYYVMRRIEGEPLVDRLARASTTRDRLALIPNVLAVVDAAAFAHARQIIHRDIKPSNILLGSYGETLLIDWGLARTTDEAELGSSSEEPAIEPADHEPLTRIGHVYGTIAYMSPEQARGERVDARADVYALGATMFHVVTGKSPFDGVSAVARITSATLHEDPPLHRIDPDTPPELATIIGKAMASDLDVRYRDAGQLATDLRAFLAGQLVAAHRYTPRALVARFVRRHRLVVAIASLAVVAMVVGGSLAIRGVMQARDTAEDARQAAEAQRAIAMDRAETSMLDRASTLATTDPTRAVALLRQVAATSPNLSRARDIASIAAAAGIAHGSTVHHNPIRALSLAPDGRSLVSSDAKGGLAVHDIATGATRSLPASGAVVRWAVWNDATTVTVNATSGLQVIDLRSGARRLLVPEAKVEGLWNGASAELIRYVDSESKALWEISLRGGSPRQLASDVVTAVVEGDLALLDGTGPLRVLDGDREVVLDPREPLSTISLAISRRLGRVAASFQGEVVEWDSLDGRVRGRWPVDRALILTYGDSNLYAATNGGEILVLGTQAAELARTDQGVSWAANSSVGAVFGFSNGRIVVVDAGGAHELLAERAGTRVIAARSTSPYVATGSTDGLVRWWDLELMKPRAIPVPFATVCGWDTTSLYTLQRDAFVAIDRATGTQRTLNRSIDLVMASCGGTIGARHLAVSGPNGVALIDRTTGEITPIPRAKAVLVDEAADVLLVAYGSELVERLGGATPERIVWKAPASITAIHSRGRWIALVLADSSIVRIDRTTSRHDVLAVKNLGFASLAASGEVWFEGDSTVSVWDGNAAVPVHKFSSPVEWGLAEVGAFSLSLADGSLWLVQRGGTINRAGPGRRFTVFTRGAVAWSNDSGQLITRYLLTGEQVVRRLRGLSAVSSSDEDTSAVLVRVGPHLYLYRDSVPPDPADLAPWIDRVTNAVIARDTGELTWPD